MDELIFYKAKLTSTKWHDITNINFKSRITLKLLCQSFLRDPAQSQFGSHTKCASYELAFLNYLIEFMQMIYNESINLKEKIS